MISLIPRGAQKEGGAVKRLVTANLQNKKDGDGYGKSLSI